LEKEIIIPLSKGKILLIVLGSIAFVVGGIYIFMLAHDQSRYHPLFMQIVGVVGVVFFSWTGLMSLKKLFDPQPGLVINQKGITDNSSGVSVGFIPWQDITEIKSTQIALTKFLIVQLNNPEEYLDRSIRPLQKRLLKANYKKYGTPISISVNTLKVKFNPLVQMLTEAWEIYKS